MPVGFRIASAWVDIRAEDKGLRDQVKAAVQKAVDGQDGKIGLEISSKGLRRQVQDALKEATKGQKPQVDIGIKTTGLRKEVTDALKAATAKQKPFVQLGISTVGLRGEVQRALKEATKDQKPTVQLSISAIGLRDEVERALAAATAGQAASVQVNTHIDTDALQRTLADAHPTISPNLDNQRMLASLRATIAGINREHNTVTINTDIDGSMLRAKIQADLAKMQERMSIPIRPDVDMSAFVAAIERAQRTASAAVPPIQVEMNPHVNDLMARAEVARLRAIIGKIEFNGTLNEAMLAASIKAAQLRMNAMHHDLRFRAQIDIDNAQVLAKIAEMNALIDKSGGHFGRWSKLVIAGALAIPPALSIVDYAIRTVGASSAILVGYATAFAVVGVTMSVGMNNVVNAITNASKNLDDYYMYLDELTPNARAFVTTVVGMTGSFKGLQAVVQQTMFQGMAKDMQDMSRVTIPSFTVGLGGMAMVLNGMMKGILQTTTSLVKMGTMNKMFGGLQLAMEPLVPIPGQLLNAIVKLSTAAYPMIIKMNTAFAGWATTMTTRLNNAFTDGTLQAGITKAANSIKNFFKNIANNPEFEEFMKRIKDNGPALSKAFGTITEALMRIVNALAPVDALILKIVASFAGFVNALPIEVLTIFITKLVVFKTALLVSALVLKLSDAFLVLRTALLLLNNQAAMVSLITRRMAAMGATAGMISATATAMRALGKAIVGVLAITTVLYLLDRIGDRAKGAAPSVDKLTTSLQNLSTTGKFTGELKSVFVDIDGFIAKLAELDKKQAEQNKNDSSGPFGIHIPGLDDIGSYIAKKIKTIAEGKKSLSALKDDFKSLDSAFAGMTTQGYGKVAAADMLTLQNAWVSAGYKLSDFKKEFPQYKDALDAANAAQKVSALSMGAFGDKAIEVSDHIQTLQQNTDGLVKSLFALNGVQRDANQSVRDLDDSAEAMAKATAKRAIGLKFENGVVTQNTKAQRDATAAMEDTADKTEKAALATYTATGNWDKANKILVDNKNAIIKAAEAAGMGTVQAKQYADSILKIPSKKEIQIMVVDEATTQLQSVTAAYRAAPNTKTITVSVLNTTAVQSLQDMGYLVTQLPDGQFQVTAKTAPAESALKKLDNIKISPKTVEILANLTEITTDIDTAQAKVDSLKQKRATVTQANSKKLEAQITAAQKKVDSLKQKRATEIKALDKTGSTLTAIQKKLAGIKDKTVTVTVKMGGGAQAAAGNPYFKAQGGLIHRAMGGPVAKYAGGGFTGMITGPGGPTSDSISAMLSNGEYVVKAEAVKKYGAGMLTAINTGNYPYVNHPTDTPRYAGGGPVGSSAGLSGAGGISGARSTASVPQPAPIVFTALDATVQAMTSAKNNIYSVTTAQKLAQQTMARDAQTFSGQYTVQWANMGHKLTATTVSTGAGVKTATTQMGTAVTGSLGTTSAAGLKDWNSFKSGMLSRTAATYAGIQKSTSSFGSQTTSKMGSIVSGTGAAWGKLSPKFKTPVSYLVHTVVNQGIVGSMNAIMQKLGGGSKISAVSIPGFATGGVIQGPGTKTSDSITARLSKGEYVMQAKAVDKFGPSFMNMVNSGKLPHNGAGAAGFAKGGMVGHNINLSMAPGFASGGLVKNIPSADTLNKIMGDGTDADVKNMTSFIMDNYVKPLIDSGPGGSAMKAVMNQGASHIQSNVEDFVKKNFGGAGSAAAGLRWAKTQDGKPYQWGGNGNPSWDCSGFMSAIESVIRGEKPHRRWATGSFSGKTAPSGWTLGANAPFKIGVTNAGVGHTAGTIGKTNVESHAGGIDVGAKARGWNDGMFPSHYGYTGPSGHAAGGYIKGPGTGTSDSIHARLSDGEYVIRAAAVKKYGTGFLNRVNQGGMPGFASGGVVTAKKAPKGDIQDTSSATALAGLVTISQISQAAVALGHTIDNETQAALRAQGSLGDLMTGLNNTKNAIAAAFKGKTETVMLAKFSAVEGQLMPLQNNLDKVNASLADAQTSLDAVKGQFDDLKTSVAGSITSFANITKVGAYGTSTNTLITQLQTDVNASSAFADNLKKLQTMGLSGDLINQIASAGMGSGGDATAQSLIGATPEQIAQLNALQAQLGTVADNAGGTAASAMYGAGVNAAQGLVDGLKSQSDAITAQMKTIAESMVKAIKDALGIKSPSKVMGEVGDFTAEGLIRAVVARQGDANDAIRALVPSQPMSGMAGVRSGAGRSIAGTITSGGCVTNIGTINVNVSGTFDLSKPAERKNIAKALVVDIKEAIRLDDKKHK